MSVDKLTEEEIEENKEKITTLLKNTEREGIERLIGWMENTDYFKAPASSRKEYHGCYEGGLAQHSLNVYELFRDKVKKFDLEIQEEEMIISTLLHDLCKTDHYKPNMIKKGKGKKAKKIQSSAKPYKVEDKLPCGHGEKSAILASRHIILTDKEIMLIRWHMGPYDEGWERYGEKAKKKCPAITAMHNADNEASKYLD